MRALLFVLTFFMIEMLVAQNDSLGQIRGIVVDEQSNQPISGVNVTLEAKGLSTVSDADGKFMFSPLTPGLYDVRFQLDSFRTDTFRGVYVSAMKTTYITQRMARVITKPAKRRFLRNKKMNFTDGNIRGFSATPRHHFIEPFAIRTDTALTATNGDEPAIDKKRFALIAGAQSALVAGSLIGLHQLWYKQYPRSDFHGFNDNAEWLQMDKVGHVQSAYSIGYVSAEMWRWTHMKQRRCIVVGAITGFSYLTAIEIMDGYSSGWGFSTGDLIANAAGSSLLIGQELLWRDQRITPKFGFRRSGYAAYRPELLGDGYHEEFLKDYNGQTYWLSVNIASFLPEETKFPQWLNLAVGYGANGMTGGHENPVMYNSQGNEITLNRYRQYYLSLDIDLRKIPVKSRFLRAVFNMINFIKVPAPGIELSKHGVRPLLIAF